MGHRRARDRTRRSGSRRDEARRRSAMRHRRERSTHGAAAARPTKSPAQTATETGGGADRRTGRGLLDRQQGQQGDGRLVQGRDKIDPDAQRRPAASHHCLRGLAGRIPGTRPRPWKRMAPARCASPGEAAGSAGTRRRNEQGHAAATGHRGTKGGMGEHGTSERQGKPDASAASGAKPARHDIRDAEKERGDGRTSTGQGRLDRGAEAQERAKGDGAANQNDAAFEDPDGG